MGGELPQAYGPYVLLKALGNGSMGDVHLARPFDAEAGIPTPVVIKRMHPELAELQPFVERFRHEAALAIRIDSPNVAKVYDVGAVGESLYLAMEYVAGWPVSRILREHMEARAPLSLASVIELVAGAAEGLRALHGASDPKTGELLGVVHRDVSPKNLMVGEDGRARVIDLGLGKSKLQSWKTRTGAVMGAVGYMAPEQLTATGVDHRSDLYALGVVLFELLTLSSYIERGPIPLMLERSLKPVPRAPSSLRSDVPPALDRLVIKAIALRPEDRFQAAGEMLEALRALVPERRDGGMATLIGNLLFSDLAGARSELAQLLSLTLPEPEPKTRVTVFVRREAQPIAALEPTVVEPRAPRLAPAFAPVRAPPRSSLSAPLWLLGTLTLLGVAIAIDRALIAPADRALPLPPPSPSIRAVPASSPEPVAPIDPSPPAPPPTPSAAAGPHKKKPPTKPALAELPELRPPSPPPARIAEATPEDQLDATKRLYGRVLGLQAAFPKESPEAGQARALLDRFRRMSQFKVADPALKSDVERLESSRPKE